MQVAYAFSSNTNQTIKQRSSSYCLIHSPPIPILLLFVLSVSHCRLPVPVNVIFVAIELYRSWNPLQPPSSTNSVRGHIVDVRSKESGTFACRHSTVYYILSCGCVACEVWVVGQCASDISQSMALSTNGKRLSLGLFPSYLRTVDIITLQHQLVSVCQYIPFFSPIFTMIFIWYLIDTASTAATTHYSHYSAIPFVDEMFRNHDHHSDSLPSR
jgi:hypothetical protein